MMGKSWGGFNSLQVAAHRPPELKAVVTVCSTDDRYADDVHYMGGCLLNENLSWGSVLMDYNAYPPDPAIVGERWRAMWLDRLENAVCFPELWLTHQRRDDYWKHGSVCEDYDAIDCPVYAIGGWADAYSNAIPRLLTGLKAPRKGLIGPWAHLYPQDGVPGPAIGFLQEALRWWDHWLKDIDTGIMAEPMMRVWMQESAPPKSFSLKRPGRWVAENQWPSPRIHRQRYWLNEERLSAIESVRGRADIRSAQTTGLTAGEWCPFGAPGEAARDQRSDDGYSLVFDSAPLEERTEILGAPAATLDMTSDRPMAFLALRLNDVAPDGASALVTYGLLNLTHHCGHGDPEPLEPGKRYRITIKLNDIAHAFVPGHRMRLAISTSYWPIAWPAPEAATITLILGESFFDLPVRPPGEQDAELKPFPLPECAPSQAIQLRPAPLKRIIERDIASDETIYTISSESGDEHDRPAIVRLEAIDLEVGHTSVKRFRMREDDPLSARAEVAHQTVFCRGAWKVRVETLARLSSTQDHFVLQAELRAYEGEQPVFERNWDRRIKRDLV
jgi:putative CocE/NonD family hydrolase